VIARAVDVDGAWFHPYDFPWGGIQPPWYSGLAQGRALMLFCRLYEATGNPIYRDAAEKTFASFLVKGPREKPWVVDVDESNRLWLQEYPGAPSDYTFNGHMVGVYGLYDYYRMSRDERALALLRGGLTTQLDASADFRQPAWKSLYCLKHQLTATAAYHEIHVKFFLYSHRITGDYRFARLADSYEADYPRDGLRARIRVSKGRHEAITPSGRPTWIASSRPSEMTVTFRRRLKGRAGYWFWINSGPYGGYWIREKAKTVFYPGQAVRMDYLPRRTLLVPKTGAYVLRKYSSAGAIGSTKYLRFPVTRNPGTLQLPIRSRAVIRGRSHVRISSGTYSGYWIELRGVTLK
jgi:hypothetical protein